jgi:hypothetical protein
MCLWIVHLLSIDCHLRFGVRDVPSGLQDLLQIYVMEG